MVDYWRDMSYGSIDLTGSVVKGWYTLKYTYDKDRTNHPPERITSAIQDVANNHKGKIDFSSYYGIAVMLNTLF